MLLQFSGFKGAATKESARLLPVQIGVDSQNLRPDFVDFRPWGAPTNKATVPASQKTIYRLGRDAPSDTAYWCSWGADVDAVTGFLGSDSAERTFITGDGIPKWFDNTMLGGGPPYPVTSRPLGMPPPINPPLPSITVAGTGDAETRYYLATWVSDKREESAPSPVSIKLTCNTDAEVSINRVSTVPSDGRVYTTWRLYRTQPNANGAATFYFQAELPVATSTYTEAAGSASFVETLPSLYWDMPDPGLTGITALWDGIFAAFVGKKLYFCEAYRHFAWPNAYALSTKDTIVGLGVWNKNLIVLTTGQHYVVTGGIPSSMSMAPLRFKQACVSKRSIVSSAMGVVWASPAGLVMVGDNGGVVLTDAVLSLQQWTALAPSTMRAAQLLNTLYVASYTVSGEDHSFVIDLANPGGIYYYTTGFADLYWDEIQAALFVLSGTNVQKWDTGALLTGLHKSGVRRAEKPTHFKLVQVIADSYPVTVTVWNDGVALVTNKTIPSRAAQKLPPGLLCDEWQVSLSGATGVQVVNLATGIGELKAIK
jgi:hypothetical protein